MTALLTMFPAAFDEIHERETNSEAAANNCNGILQSLSTDLLRQLKSLSHYLQSPSMHLIWLVTSTNAVVEERRSDINYQKMVDKEQNLA